MDGDAVLRYNISMFLSYYNIHCSYLHDTCAQHLTKATHPYDPWSVEIRAASRGNLLYVAYRSPAKRVLENHKERSRLVNSVAQPITRVAKRTAGQEQQFHLPEMVT